MKKVLVVFVIFLLFCLSIGISYADGCPIHQWMYAVSGTRTVSYTQKNASNHTEHITQHYSCSFCAESLPAQYWITEEARDEPHSIVSSWDGGHVGTTKTHCRHNRCKCAYTWSSFYPCSGNPCIYPQHIDYIE